MSKYIDADRLYKDITRSIDYCEDILEIVERQPAVDVQEVKHGRWVETIAPELWECSVCGCVIYSETEIDRNIYHKWCGRCGAKMDGKEKENATD